MFDDELPRYDVPPVDRTDSLVEFWRRRLMSSYGDPAPELVASFVALDHALSCIRATDDASAEAVSHARDVLRLRVANRVHDELVHLGFLGQRARKTGLAQNVETVELPAESSPQGTLL